MYLSASLKISCTFSVACIPLKQGEIQPAWTPAVKAISEWTPQTIMGDVNADGAFSIADAVLLQKWLLAVPDAELKKHFPQWKGCNQALTSEGNSRIMEKAGQRNTGSAYTGESR